MDSVFRSVVVCCCTHMETSQSNQHHFKSARIQLLYSLLSPQSSGQWVGCVVVDEGGDWMVCAGSMPPSIYRLPSNNKIATLSVPSNVVTQSIIFANDRVSFAQLYTFK